MSAEQDWQENLLKLADVIDERDRLRAENNRLRAALQFCAADWISNPCTIMDGALMLSEEFRRRMNIAHSALTEAES